MHELTLLLDGLRFPEGPRWHDGKLWFSDMQDDVVMTVDAAGRTEIIARVPNQPSGLGWLPDGRLLIVSMTDRKLLRLDPEGLHEVVQAVRQSLVDGADLPEAAAHRGGSHGGLAHIQGDRR